MDDRPALEIGSEAAGYQFSGIRGAVRLSDGRIVVGDGGSSEVRTYDRAGGLLSTTGRSGGGPNEFRGMARLVRAAADSVVVFDAAVRRVSVLGPDGSFARTLAPSAITVGAALAGVLENGSFVFGVPLPLPPRGGLSRDSVLYVLVSPDGRRTDTLGIAPGGQQFERRDGQGIARLSVPFGPLAAAAAGSGRIVFGATDRYELRQHGPDGAPARVIRRAVVPQPFTDAHHRQAVDGFPPRIAAALAGIPRPGHAPVFAAIMIDRRDHLWVQDFPSPGAARSAWAVFDPRGTLLGEVQLPASLQPTDIGADYVLGVWRDELGVERLRMHPLRKP